MTCVAGLVAGDDVWLAADSAGVAGWDLAVRADRKIFRAGPYVVGYTTSWRMGQLLQYRLKVGNPDGRIHEFMCTTFVDAVRDCLNEGGWRAKKNDREEGGTFIVGVYGTLFTIDSDFQVAEPQTRYDAIGCGKDIALGSLFTTQGLDLPPRVRLDIAVRAAEQFSNGVRGPVVFTSTGELE